MGDLHEHNKQNKNLPETESHANAKNILCLDGNDLSFVQRINLNSKIKPNYCFCFQLILYIWYFQTKQCVLCFADLTQESLSAARSSHETKPRLANTYMLRFYCLKSPRSSLSLPPVWTLSDASC